MTVEHFMARLLVGGLLVCGFASPASAKADKVTPQEMLRYRPRQEAQVSTPTTEAEIAACKVEVANGAGGTSAGAA